MTEKYEYCSTVPRTFVQDCTCSCVNFHCFFIHAKHDFVKSKAIIFIRE